MSQSMAELPGSMEQFDQPQEPFDESMVKNRSAHDAEF